MADPIFGSKYGPQNGVQNWVTFSFLLLGLCLGPVLGSRFGPKSGASHRKILLLPADVSQADLRRTSMSVSVNTCFFSLCVPICFLYSSKRPWDAQREKVCVDIHVQAAGSQICLQNICGQQRNSPMADPIFGSKYGPQNGVQNWVTFSFLLLGLCLGPVLGSRFGPKSGASHRKILLLPADVSQADLRRTSMSVSVNTCFFSLCVPICFLYSSKRPWDAQREKVCVDIHVQAAGSQICLQNICGQQRNSPMADPIFGSKYGPQNGVQNWVTFSFLLLGLCLGPVLGSRFGPKSGASHRKILLLPADVSQADLRRTSMSVSVNTCFFSLCVPICFLYSRGPFMAAMFLVFWILFSGP